MDIQELTPVAYHIQFALTGAVWSVYVQVTITFKWGVSIEFNALTQYTCTCTSFVFWRGLTGQLPRHCQEYIFQRQSHFYVKLAQHLICTLISIYIFQNSSVWTSCFSVCLFWKQVEQMLRDNLPDLVKDFICK